MSTKIYLSDSYIKVNPNGDMRETQISQFYRYAKISKLLEAGQFCRYVGGV